MQFLRMGSRILGRTSPWGFIAAGAAIALALPPVRKGLRCAAVATTRGVLGIMDQAIEFTSNIREQAEDIMAEARSGETCNMAKDWEEAFETTKTYPRDLAIGAATAGLAVSEHVGEHAKIVKEHVQGIVDEAKMRRARITSPVNNIEPTNEPVNESANAEANKE